MAPPSIPSSSNGRPDESTSNQGVKDMLEDTEVPVSEKAREEPLDSSPVQCVWYPGHPHHERPPSPRRSPDAQMDFMPINPRKEGGGARSPEGPILYETSLTIRPLSIEGDRSGLCHVPSMG
ncbi:hypothetical protein LIER_18160 [Lithospermum erythrorhizon]|uniref:Uncharacterized protein n=1 Tax=Lithospermum erythrorhizon TaxID=34254 RepID=A0AAV3QDZ4_LITER